MILDVLEKYDWFLEIPKDPFLIESAIKSILIEIESAYLDWRKLSDREIIEAIPYDTHFKENLAKTILDVWIPYIFRKTKKA